MTRRAWLGSAFAANIRLARTDGPYQEFDPSKAKATVIIFLSTICPVSNAYQDRIKELMRRTGKQPVQWLLANANDNESPAETERYASEIQLPIYVDRYGQMADRFGAVLTPEAVVVGNSGDVLYQGAIDDSQNPARVKVHALRDAIDAALAGKTAPVRNLRAFGCAIKRKDSR